MERPKNIKFELYSEKQGFKEIPLPIDYSTNLEVIEMDDKSGSYVTSVPNAFKLHSEAFDYLDFSEAKYGINQPVRILRSVKNPFRGDERLETNLDLNLDLTTLKFEPRKRTVEVNSSKDDLLKVIESRFNEEYDLNQNKTADGVDLTDIKKVTAVNTPRAIQRKSRLFVEDGVIVRNVVGDNLLARAIPFQVDYNSDANNIKNTFGNELSAGGGNYVGVSSDKQGNVIFYNFDRDKTLYINGKINFSIINPNIGTLTLDLVKYDGGGDLNYVSKVNLSSVNPAGLGNVCSYTFDNYKLEGLEGESFAIGTLANIVDGVYYQMFDTEIVVTENSKIPQTECEAIKPFDLFERLTEISTGESNAFKSPIFEAGGKYENILAIHGTMLRNMPKIINEGDTDEVIVSASLSLKDAFEAYSILEPLVYDMEIIGNKKYFIIDSKKNRLKKFTGVRLGETINGKFTLLSVNDEVQTILKDICYSSITLGSNKSGQDYGEVNNLFSISGKGIWNTINKYYEAVYSATTDFRTASEGFELCREVQYEKRPEEDTPYDNDWFLLDAKLESGKYVPKKWRDYYEVEPTGVYDVESEYNWIFTPARLLLGHGFQINAGLIKDGNESIQFVDSTCNKALVTKKEGQIAIAENQAIPHSLLDKPYFLPKMIEFSLNVNQEISDMIDGETEGVPNKYGLIEYLSEGKIKKGLLAKVDKNNGGSFQLIEAYI